METLAQLLEETARRHGSRVALQMRGSQGVTERWTYDELYRYACAIAHYLRAQGLKKGDRLILWGPNTLRWPAVFYGAMLAGVVVVPLDVKSSEEFLGKIESRTAAMLIVSARSAIASLTGQHAETLAFEDLDTLLPPRDSVGLGQLEHPASGDPAELVFTSGTTGTPKGVVLTHGNILSDAQAATEILAPRPAFSFLSLLPLSHMFEQMAMLYATLGGSRVTYMETLQPASIFQAIEQEGINIIPCVPQVLALFMQGIEREVKKRGKLRQWELLHRVAHRLPFGLRHYLFPAVHKRLGGHFEFFICGGAHLDPALGQKWEDMGVRVVIAYGMTEASPAVTANTYNERDMHSVGRPIACNQIKIAPDGEVLVRGANVFPGYWQDDAATREAFEDGWYKTGDLGSLDAAGRLRLKGRKKNMIVLSNGFNVYPEDVEQVLLQSPALTDAVVVGLEGEGSEVDVHAILLTKEPEAAEAAVKAANRKLAPHQRIKDYTVWPDEDFPRTHTLKAKRQEMVPRLLRLRAGQELSGRS